MHKITVEDKPLTLNAGRLKLNEDQARRRAHLLNDVGQGVYEIVNPVQFKVGETFEFDGENKSLPAEYRLAMHEAAENPATSQPARKAAGKTAASVKKD